MSPHPIAFVPLLLPASIAAAQSNLGELLDAGAQRLSAEEFKKQIVQRVIVGPTGAGGRLEYMLAANGTVSGSGVPRANVPETSNTGTISGEWRTDDADRVCLTMRMGMGPSVGLWLPSRCQFWYRLGDTYFFSDSDQDRSAPVLSRKLKP